MKKVRLCWIPKKTWDNTEGLKHTIEFDCLEHLQEVMSKHIPNGEWVEDIEGNRLNVKIRYAKMSM